jgi:hypothetical protein
MITPFDINLMTNEYFKLAKIMLVSILGFVEDEWTLSMFAFLKDKLCNRLGLHLDTIVRMFAQEFCIQDNFHYQEAITTWKD